MPVVSLQESVEDQQMKKFVTRPLRFLAFIVALCVIRWVPSFDSSMDVRTAEDHPVPAKEALELLKEGNRRYTTTGGKETSLWVRGAGRRALVARGQSPMAAIVGCADSRVPVEAIFDAGPGDIFVLRNAGNTCTHAEGSFVGSLEFAVENLRAKLIIVMGHTKCGALMGATKTMLSMKEAGHKFGHEGEQKHDEAEEQQSTPTSGEEEDVKEEEKEEKDEKDEEDEEEKGEDKEEEDEEEKEEEYSEVAVEQHEHADVRDEPEEKQEPSTELESLLIDLAPIAAEAADDLPEDASVECIASLAGRLNVFHTVDGLLSRSKLLRDRVRQGDVLVLGAVYDLESGEVDFLGESPNQAAILR